MPAKRKSSLSSISKNAKRMKLLRNKVNGSEDDVVHHSVEIEGGSLDDTQDRVRNICKSKRRKNENVAQRTERLAKDREAHRIARGNESEEQRDARLSSDQQRHIANRQNQAEEQRDARLSNDRQRHFVNRQNESDEQQDSRLSDDRQRHFVNRQNESDEHRDARLSNDRQRHFVNRQNESDEQQDSRLSDDRQRHFVNRQNESDEHRDSRLSDDRQRHFVNRQNESDEQRDSRLSDDQRRHFINRQNESQEERNARLFVDCQRHIVNRQNESVERRETRLSTYQQRYRLNKQNESLEHREMRLRNDRNRHELNNAERQSRLEREVETIRNRRSNETVEEVRSRQIADRERQSLNREIEPDHVRQNRRAVERARHEERLMKKWKEKNNSGFSYDPNINYSEAASIGSMNVVCEYCKALRWPKESNGMCCSSGKVVLPPLLEPPEPIRSLLDGVHRKSQFFLKHSRGFNSAFQMTSFGANEVHEPGFQTTYRVQGQIYHMIGSILPSNNQPHKFLQIYFISDAQEQADRRSSLFNTLDKQLMLELQECLHNHNSYIRSFKSALELLDKDSENHKIIIKADGNPIGDHPGRYNAPSVSEVAVIMVGEPSNSRDIVLQKRRGGPIRICETHRSYDALQYPLIFCHGEDGYHFLYCQTNPATGQLTNKKISALQFYAYRMMIRQDQKNYLLEYGQLTNQLWVDEQSKIESERLLYFQTHQKELRAEQYIHLQDAIRRDEHVENLGQMVILPSSFTGGPRYMHSRTQDAFCYVRKFGRPDLFITMTTNPKWSEIRSMLSQGQTAQHRHDIISRVFHLKVKCLMELLRKGKLFGNVQCFIYSIEWQKRGLPHVHILLWLEEALRPNQVDSIIRAEIPNPEEDMQLFEIVKSNMVHGPCGPLNRQSVCMKEGRCSKKFPKKFVKETVTGEDSYPTYRRRSPEDGGFSTPFKVRGQLIMLDNRWIVPYSPVLSRTFNAHINVEFCNSVKSIKYICKYVNKGSDQATIGITNENDEVTRYRSGRYLSTSEAVWRILSFSIHERYPPVIQLQVHLENGQRVYFRPENVLERVENPINSTLMAFFQLCQVDIFARTLLYAEVPSYFTFNKQDGKFFRRKRGKAVEGHAEVFKDPAIGRVYTIHPQNSECFYLRLLLHHIRVPTSFESLRTIMGVIHTTYKAAARALGLTEDDNQWDEVLKEAASFDSPFKIRELFSIILVFCDPKDPLDLWMKFRNALSEDYLREAQRAEPNTTFQNSPNLYDLCLTAIQEITLRIGSKTLSDCHLPVVISNQQINSEYIREMSYDITQLLSFVMDNEVKLTNEQNEVYQNVLSIVDVDGPKQIHFLDAPGGTGKTFLINLLLAKIRSESKIAIAVASSGIAATLLPGGRTAHSKFKIPINIEQMETPVCSISRNCAIAEVLRKCVFIVWDESTMAHKKSIEALNRTLQDVRNNNLCMGGVTVLFSGDFRQTLPVVTRGSRADQVNASIKNSILWTNIKLMSLSINMRVRNSGEQETQEFADLLISIGEGTIDEHNDRITIPSSLGTVITSQEELIGCVFPNIEKLPTIHSSWLCDRAILTPTNEQAAQINKKILSLFQAEEKTYLSVNTPINEDDFVHYPREFLDSVTAPGLPAHELNLKIGAPIMLLRNINPPKMCNGTRLRVRALHTSIIEAEILTGCASGEIVFVPRIPIIPTNYPFEFKRLQFPVSLCFAMTVNKSQGQTLSTAGIDVSASGCFSHGQLYVACSRVRSPKSLFIHAPTGRTENIVYREVLQ